MEESQMIALVVLMALASLLFVGLVRAVVRVVVVPEYERIVIYRLGRFERLAGPGRVFYLNGMHRIVQRINLLDRPTEFLVAYMFLNGVPLSLTISMWCRLDPEQAVGLGRDRQRRLAEMLQYTDDDRREQTQLLLREAVMRRAAEFNRQNPVDMKANFFVKLMPVLPGQPASRQLLDKVRLDIISPFRRLGIIVNTQQPMVIRRLGFSDSITIGMDWQRLTKSLRESFPDMNDDTLAQIVGSIEGLDPLTVQRNTTEVQGLGQAAVTVGVGQGPPNTVVVPPLPQPAEIPAIPSPGPAADARPEPTQEAPESPTQAPAAIPSDWSLLKSVPE